MWTVIRRSALPWILVVFYVAHLSSARLHVEDLWKHDDQNGNVDEPKKLSPVIFIPGDGGSQVEAKLNKTSTIHYYCEKTTSDFFNIWLNPKLLVPLVIECWIDNVLLYYDNVTRTTSNTPGVEIRIPGFGQSEVVEWLDPSITRSLAGAYFKDIANVLVKNGYVRNVTLRGAPFDFRKAPIPGCGGNRLKARLHKDIVPHVWCFNNADWFDVWLGPFQLLPGEIDCWVDNMKLTYNNITRTTSNTPGVETGLPKWGDTDEMEWVDSTPVVDNYDYGAYFHYIAAALVKRGYVRGDTLFGAPYDFRKGPNENKYWFERLKDLTECAYRQNKVGITYIAHSMGGRMILHFLQSMPQSWKDQYVKQVITLSSPWGGSVQALQSISVGYDFGATVLQNSKMKAVQETCPSVLWLMPSQYFWKPNEVLAAINGKNYTLNNIDEFFYDIGNPNAAEMRKDLAGFDNFTAPGVEMHCLYGKNTGDTVDELDFGSSFNPKPRLVLGDGDGTVNKRSLIGCRYWKNTAAQAGRKIFEQEFPGIEHYNMLSQAAPINYIVDNLIGIADYPQKDEITSKSDTMKIRLF